MTAMTAMTARRLGLRVATTLGWANALGAAGLLLLMGYFLLSSLACGDITDYVETPLDRSDSAAVEAIFRANAVKNRTVRDVSSRDGEGRIVSLSLEDAGLTTLPADIGELDALVSLNLANNKLKTLPLDMEKLIDLEDLQLQGNIMASLPDGMRFESLKVADIHGNILDSLPGNLDITSIRKLNLSGNRLIRLPPDFRYLHNLQTLELQNNRLDSLKVDFTLLTSLRALDLSHNHLVHLSPTLTELSPGFLDVADNLLCFPEDSQDSALSRQTAWLDEMDRDWRSTQTCP